MKSPLRSLLIGAALAAAAASAATPALAQTNVSINIGQPGFYGRIDLGDFAQRPVVYTQQPIIVREVREVRSEPIYLRVPPQHRHEWSRYCGRYDACGRPVMFVRDDWYTNTYAPRYRERHYEQRPLVREVREVRYVEERRDDDDRYDKHGKGHGHGHGNGHGNGHGKGHGRGHDRDD